MQSSPVHDLSFAHGVGTTLAVIIVVLPLAVGNHFFCVGMSTTSLDFLCSFVIGMTSLLGIVGVRSMFSKRHKCSSMSLYKSSDHFYGKRYFLDFLTSSKVFTWSCWKLDRVDTFAPSQCASGFV